MFATLQGNFVMSLQPMQRRSTERGWCEKRGCGAVLRRLRLSDGWWLAVLVAVWAGLVWRQHARPTLPVDEAVRRAVTEAIAKWSPRQNWETGGRAMQAAKWTTRLPQGETYWSPSRSLVDQFIREMEERRRWDEWWREHEQQLQEQLREMEDRIREQERLIDEMLEEQRRREQEQLLRRLLDEPAADDRWDWKFRYDRGW